MVLEDKELLRKHPQISYVDEIEDVLWYVSKVFQYIFQIQIKETKKCLISNEKHSCISIYRYILLETISDSVSKRLLVLPELMIAFILYIIMTIICSRAINSVLI